MRIKRINKRATLPTRATNGSAGYDVYAVIDEPNGEVQIEPHENKLIGLGFAVAIPNGYVGCLFARSGLANKRGLRPSNCVGVIDEDYRGEVMVSLRNDTNHVQTVKDGERVAQLVFVEYYAPGFEEVDDLDDTDRGTGGFGSTGM